VMKEFGFIILYSRYLYFSFNLIKFNLKIPNSQALFHHDGMPHLISVSVK